MEDIVSKRLPAGWRRYPQQNHFYCDRESEEDWNRLERTLPTDEEVVSFLGNPPRQEDLPDCLTAEEPPRRLPPENRFYVIMPNDLLNDPELNNTDRAVWQVYFKYSQPKDRRMEIPGSTFVGQPRIAKELRCFVLTVRKATAKLIKTGWISIKYQHGFSNLITVSYRKTKE